MPAGDTANRSDCLPWYLAPIRTHAEVAAEMRRRGDLTMVTKSVYYYEKRALAKLRAALSDLEEEI